MSDFLKLVGARIRYLRKAKGWTLEDFEEKSGLQYSYIGGIERGNRNISLETIEKIVNALDIEAVELFQFEEIDVDNDLLDKKQLIEIHKSMLLERNIDELNLVHKTVKDILTLIDSQKIEKLDK